MSAKTQQQNTEADRQDTDVAFDAIIFAEEKRSAEDSGRTAPYDHKTKEKSGNKVPYYLLGNELTRDEKLREELSGTADVFLIQDVIDKAAAHGSTLEEALGWKPWWADKSIWQMIKDGEDSLVRSVIGSGD